MAEFFIKDGTGTGKTTKVDDNNQMHVYAVSSSEVQDAVDKGNAYNINTGTIALTSSSDSAVLYFKNNEAPSNGESAINIDAIAIGINNDGTNSEMAEITVVKNPTAGTIVSGAAAVAMNQNRNFGSSATLSESNIYKGAEGNTFTDGNDIALFFQSAGARGYYSVDFELEKGSSIGVKVNPKTTAATTTIYVAIICHRKDGSNN